jgi:hypothetical protein
MDGPFGIRSVEICGIACHTRHPQFFTVNMKYLFDCVLLTDCKATLNISKIMKSLLGSVGNVQFCHHCLHFSGFSGIGISNISGTSHSYLLFSIQQLLHTSSYTLIFVSIFH